MLSSVTLGEARAGEYVSEALDSGDGGERLQRLKIAVGDLFPETPVIGEEQKTAAHRFRADDRFEHASPVRPARAISAHVTARIAG